MQMVKRNLAAMFALTIIAASANASEQSFVFTNQLEAEAALRRWELESQTNILKRLKSVGASNEEIIGLEESYALQNVGVSIKKWSDWTNYYRPFILAPPIQFDARTPQPADFSNPVAAFRSFQYGVFSGNANLLLANADQSGKAWLKEMLGVDPKFPEPTYGIFTNKSVFTILLTATNTVNGQDYSMVLARAQEHTNPKAGLVSFIVHFFKRNGNAFVFTRDKSIFGPFGGIVEIAGAGGANLLPYPDFLRECQRSSFPPHFFTIED